MIKKMFKRLLDEKYLPYLVAMILLIPSLVWIFLDNHVWPWDQAWYGEVSVTLYYNLTHSISLWPQAMMSAFGIKAPAIAWFGQFFVPLSNLVGSVDRALLLYIVLFQFLSLIFIYKIILFLTNKNKNLALLGMIILASAPLFIGMGHQYFVESLQLFAVVFTIFIFINIGTWNKYNSIIAFIIALSYAMLVKITSPLYIMPILALGFIYLIKNPQKESIKDYFKKRKNIILWILGILFSLAVISWYVINWNTIFQFMKLASSGEAAELYGTKDSFYNKFNLWITFFRQSFFVSILAYVVCLAMGFFAIKHIARLKNINWKENFTNVFSVSLITIVITLIFFSFQINEETRYLLPLIPYVAIIICLMLNKAKASMVFIFMGLFFGQYVFVNGVTLGLFEESQEINAWVTQMQPDKNNIKNVKYIVKKTCNRESEYKINMVGVEFPWLNANSLEYYAMQSRLKTNIICYYTSLGYAENNAENAWTRLETINPPFFIISNDKISKNLEAFNGASSQIVERIKNDPNFAQQSSSNSKNILIFKNISKEK